MADRKYVESVIKWVKIMWHTERIVLLSGQYILESTKEGIKKKLLSKNYKKR